MQVKQKQDGEHTISQVIVPLPMSLEKACQVDWEIRHGPNKGERGKMGKFLEEHKMDLGDLGWIADHAFKADERVAAVTLLAHQLGQPQTLQTTSRYGPEVISHGKYLEDQQWESQTRAAGWFGIVAFGGVTILVNFLFRAVQLIFGESQPLLAVLIALVIVLAIFLVPYGLVATYFIRRELVKAKAFRLGREGEEWMTDKIRALLDNRWVVFHNLSLPKRKEDIDLVLVGPSGVWVLEVKAFGFTVRVQNNVWQRLNGKSWQSLRSNPVAQARLNAMNLRYFIERHGAVLRVNAAVVLTQPQPVSNIGPTVEPVWKQFEVDEKLSQINILPGSLPEQDRTRIIAALKEVVERR